MSKTVVDGAFLLKATSLFKKLLRNYEFTRFKVLKNFLYWAIFQFLIYVHAFKSNLTIFLVIVLCCDFFQYGRTEVIMNNLNPDFAKSFVMDYYFEEIQKLRFEVYVLLYLCFAFIILNHQKLAT